MGGPRRGWCEPVAQVGSSVRFDSMDAVRSATLAADVVGRVQHNAVVRVGNGGIAERSRVECYESGAGSHDAVAQSTVLLDRSRTCSLATLWLHLTWAGMWWTPNAAMGSAKCRRPCCRVDSSVLLGTVS